MTLVTLLVGGFSSIGQVAFVYAILYLAVALPKAVQWIGNTNDYSYGIYIYGFLVQQVLAYLGVHRWGYWPYVVLTLVIAFGCAWLSWHLVEKRALRLKSVGPGKGIRHWWDAAAERVPWGRRTSE